MATSKNYGKKKVRITSGIFWTLMGKNPIMEKSDAGAACLNWTFFFFHNSVGYHTSIFGIFWHVKAWFPIFPFDWIHWALLLSCCIFLCAPAVISFCHSLSWIWISVLRLFFSSWPSGSKILLLAFCSCFLFRFSRRITSTIWAVCALALFSF